MRAPSALTGHQQNVRIWRETFFKLFSRTIVGPWTSLVDASAQTWRDSLSIGSEQEFLFSQREIIGNGLPAGIWIGQATLELRINELRSTIRDHNFIIFGSNYCQLPFDKWSWVTGVTLVDNFSTALLQLPASLQLTISRWVYSSGFPPPTTIPANACEHSCFHW